jgi:hypothetical protein
VETARGILKVDLPPPRPFQFRLRTLMVAVTLFCGACAFGFNYYRAKCRVEAAQRDVYEAAFFECVNLCRPVSESVESRRRVHYWEISIRAARNLCLAQCDVPFADRPAALLSYRDILNWHEGRAKDLIPENKRTFVADVARYQREADSWLAAHAATGSPTLLQFEE